MENNITRIFADRRQRGQKALVGFASAGCPTPAESLDFMRAMLDGGVDILEIGIPFSDPTADGPTSQAASQAALAAGTRLADVLDLTATLHRDYPHAGIVLFTYYNPVFHLGADAFAAQAKQAGADALLVVDVPYEEQGELTPTLKRHGLDLIPLVSPATSPERARLIAANTDSFVYYIMVRGTTGVRDHVPEDLERQLTALRGGIDAPIAAGFGISSPQMAAEAARLADAAVIGSAFVKMQLDAALTASQRHAKALDLARACADALHKAID